MAAGASRVFVISVIRDLAKQVQRQLPATIVEDIRYNPKSFPNDVKSEEVSRRVREAEILLCDGDALLTCIEAGATPKLKWAQCTWAGVDSVLKGLNFKKPSLDFTFTRVGHGFGDLMAEYVIGNIIAWEKDFAGMRQAQQRKEFNKQAFISSRPLSTLTIGILGCGSIGMEVAEKCKLMGMKVWGVNRSQKTTPHPHIDQFRGLDSLEVVLQSCDYVCSILPDTLATRNLLSGNVLKNCQQRKAVFINIGRGTVINDESLVQAVKEGWLGGAILDVFNEEPLPASSELWDLPGVVITPHIAGPSSADVVASYFTDNLQRHIANQTLLHLVDWKRGY